MGMARSGCAVCAGWRPRPVSGQQLAEARRWMVADAYERIGKSGTRIDVIQLGGHDERVHRRGALAAAIAAGEQP
jgi:hypothetical protein